MDKIKRNFGIILACFIATFVISSIFSYYLPNGVLRGIFNVLFAVSFIASLFLGTLFFSYLSYSKDNNATSSSLGNRHISAETKREVWRRDRGRCVQCGSQERLEFDHIIPFSKGGSNTARNIQLLCEKCNRTKTNKI